ncbi:MAG: polysulfide reductase NrfD [Myxococcales bacterium]|nr:polysulfide reductase NrfD [Myxococcales bacterium]
MRPIRFVIACARQVLKGSGLYWSWMTALSAVLAMGAFAYVDQLDRGLVATGMSDQVPWGAYIANFGFLDGIAASSALLMIAAYVFRRHYARRVAMLGAGIAVAASLACMLFVSVDLGRPERAWHLVPMLGSLNWPTSMLAWDVVALSGYLMLYLSLSTYVLYTLWRGKRPSAKIWYPGIIVGIFWAIAIQCIIAFLFAANVGRGYWHTALLGPRFLASSFTAGPALMILAFGWIDRLTTFKVDAALTRYLALIAAVSLQINLFLLGNELFVSFYHPTSHSASISYLFFGHEGLTGLMPWIYTSVAMQVIACVILMLHPLRKRIDFLTLACVLAVVGIWIDKGMGLITPGFVPTPIGEYLEYAPSVNEWAVSAGLWAFGLMVFTILAKASIPIETGQLREVAHTGEHAPGGPEPLPAE